MYLEILTPQKKVYEGEVSYIKVPGSNGAFEILNNHAPLISTIASAGNLELTTTENEKKSFSISFGVIEVLKNKVVVLTEKSDAN